MKFHGKNGSAELGSTDFDNLIEWQIVTSVETRRITPLGSVNGNNRYQTGMYDWDLSLRCYLSTNGVEVFAGDTGTMKLDTGDFAPIFTGEVICTGMRPSAQVNGMATITYTFLGNGDLVET